MLSACLSVNPWVRFAFLVEIWVRFVAPWKEAGETVCPTKLRIFSRRLLGFVSQLGRDSPPFRLKLPESEEGVKGLEALCAESLGSYEGL